MPEISDPRDGRWAELWRIAGRDHAGRLRTRDQ